MRSGTRIAVAALGSLSRLGVGGQGIVYSTPTKLTHLALPLVYKEFKSTVLAGLDVSVLEAMPAYLERLPFAVGMELLSQSAWPCRLVEDDGVVKGFVMPAIPDEFFTTMRKPSGVAKTPGEFQHLWNGDGFLARWNISLTYRHRYELLEAAARGLAVFHRHGMAVGDLSPKNLLFSITPTAAVFFIDCDAMRFQGRSVAKQLDTPGWEVRVTNPGEELGTAESDSFKFGLLALRLLAGDQTTRDVSKLPGSVPKSVRQLISGALDKNPATAGSSDRALTAVTLRDRCPLPRSRVPA